MLGPRQEAQNSPFYAFSTEDRGPSDHALRAIDGVTNLSGMRQYLS